MELLGHVIILFNIFRGFFIFIFCLCGVLIPRPGIKLASSALHDGFLNTGMPGKSLFNFLRVCQAAYAFF